MIEELTILTAREAAEYLRVSPYTLRKMETEGNLIPFRTPGGHRRYSLRMLNKYLEESRTSSQSQGSSESQSQAA
jgi:MerR family transcriptional regulator/heat shock protein HspR